MKVSRVALMGLVALAASGCSTPQVGADLATVCRNRYSNANGVATRQECNAYWIQYQADALKRGGPEALAAAKAEAMSYGNPSSLPPN
jgi:hypothetical protein